MYISDHCVACGSIPKWRVPSKPWLELYTEVNSVEAIRDMKVAVLTGLSSLHHQPDSLYCPHSALATWCLSTLQLMC
jgi:hypothetical protein